MPAPVAPQTNRSGHRGADRARRRGLPHPALERVDRKQRHGRGVEQGEHGNRREQGRRAADKDDQRGTLLLRESRCGVTCPQQRECAQADEGQADDEGRPAGRSGPCQEERAAREPQRQDAGIETDDAAARLFGRERIDPGLAQRKEDADRATQEEAQQNQAAKSSIKRRRTSVVAVSPIASKASCHVPTRQASGRTAGAVSTRPSGVIAALAPTHAAVIPRPSRTSDRSGYVSPSVTSKTLTQAITPTRARHGVLVWAGRETMRRARTCPLGRELVGQRGDNYQNGLLMVTVPCDPTQRACYATARVAGAPWRSAARS